MNNQTTVIDESALAPGQKDEYHNLIDRGYNMWEAYDACLQTRG